MAATHCFLLEIGTEELPPGELVDLGNALAAKLRDGLDRKGLGAAVAVKAFAGPRRLAVLVDHLPARQPDREQTRLGPPVSSAFDADGKPTRGAEGFARSCGVDVTDLEQIESPKGLRLAHRVVLPGKEVKQLLGNIVSDAVDSLPMRRPMRWGRAERSFVRPVHWLVALLDGAVIPMQIKGQTSGRNSYGHRFLHPQAVALQQAADYEDALREAFVCVAFSERRARIESALAEHAASLGLQVTPESALLDEVAALVEWPVVINGSFAPAFLEVPAEALVACMQGHQKFFPLFHGDGRIAAKFLAVANIASEDAGLMQRGYERVLAARLEDAAFFFTEDRKRRLEDYLQPLAGMIYQSRLGSMADRSKRIAGLAAALAQAFDVDPGTAQRAGLLCKADLCSHMVGEFPELQGVMGRYYARFDGEDDAVARAIEEHYLPRFAADRLPETVLGRLLAVAERLDALVGVFAVGLVPTGNRDPYGLRRAALGLVRISIEQDFDFGLGKWLTRAAEMLPDGVQQGPAVVEQVSRFVLERARNYVEDRRLCSKLVFSAAAARGRSSLLDLYRRIEALKAFSSRPEASDLAQANKRIRNILRQADRRELPVVNESLLTQGAERDLYTAGGAIMAEVASALAQEDYAAVLGLVARLHQPLARFFDDVLVMAPDAAVQANRLSLLADLGKTMNHVGDLSELST